MLPILILDILIPILALDIFSIVVFRKILIIRIYSDIFSCFFKNNLCAYNFILIYITIFMKLHSATYC